LGAAGASNAPDIDAVLRLVTLRHDQMGAGYGRATDAGTHATQVFGSAGLRLDATYTAKAAAGLLADAGERQEGGHAHAGPAARPPAPAVDGAAALPMFWHTLSAVEPRELLHDVNPADLPRPFAMYMNGDPA
jgi:hypothetical protein